MPAEGPESSGAPFEGVDHDEWDELLGRGRADGAVHAEDVAHVLRNVELTSEVLVEVHSAMEDHGIAIDVDVDHVDDTPSTMRRQCPASRSAVNQRPMTLSSNCSSVVVPGGLARLLPRMMAAQPMP